MKPTNDKPVRGGWSGGPVPEASLGRALCIGIAVSALALAHLALAYVLLFRR